MSEQDKDQESQPTPEEASGEAAPEKPPEKPAPPEEKPPWLADPATPEWQDEDEDPTVEALRGAHADAVLSARSYAGDLTLVIRRDAIGDVARTLKDDLGYGYMVDVAGADYPDREERFEVVYHLYNHVEEKRLRLKVSTDEDTPVPSVAAVWVGANWPEREAFDMYGIRFEGHPDMTRILLWEGFNGFPLRKEFPVEGIDTGAAIYPEYYEEGQGPISGDGTGWMIPKPPAPPEPEAAAEDSAGQAENAGGAENETEGGTESASEEAS